jgi:NADP-dependent 3-hydroxy acid dehydrogenase YdfG
VEAKVAVVTGASSGIGAATAVALAREGWRLALVARGESALQRVAVEARSAGGEAVVEALDAADGDRVLDMARRVRRDLGVPHLIVNSAGAGMWRFIEETPPIDARVMMDAPYFAAYNTTHAFMSDMLEANRGVIIHVGSPASRIPWPGATGYTAARWALRGLHESLCQDLEGTALRSCHVVFGEVSSGYFENNPGTHEHIPSLAAIIPVMTPERCARVIVRTAGRPRRQVIKPAMLRFFYGVAAVAPAPTRWLIARTGRRHD